MEYMFELAYHSNKRNRKDLTSRIQKKREKKSIKKNNQNFLNIFIKSKQEIKRKILKKEI